MADRLAEHQVLFLRQLVVSRRYPHSPSSVSSSAGDEASAAFTLIGDLTEEVPKSGNRPSGVGAETIVHEAKSKLLDGADQLLVAVGNQLVEGARRIDVLLGDRHHQPQIALDDLVADRLGFDQQLFDLRDLLRIGMLRRRARCEAWRTGTSRSSFCGTRRLACSFVSSVVVYKLAGYASSRPFGVLRMSFSRCSSCDDLKLRDVFAFGVHILESVVAHELDPGAHQLLRASPSLRESAWPLWQPGDDDAGCASAGECSWPEEHDIAFSEMQSLRGPRPLPAFRSAGYKRECRAARPRKRPL